ncbi:D-alanyl-D-alanine carboxypeptidase/D-alanyl-D-alanine endopeptidase [Corynebacterium frankenforstense]
MKSQKAWWITAAAVTAVLVGGVAAAGVAYDRSYGDLEHGPAFELAEPEDLMEPVDPVALDQAARDQLAAGLQAVADGAELGRFGAIVTDAANGETVWSVNPDTALRPASSTKVLTAAAAVAELGAEDRITTAVYRGENPGRIVLKATGDVWLNSDSLDELAAAVRASGTPVEEVAVDVSAWSGERILSGWNPVDVDAGFVAPLDPVMINGARIDATEGDVPRSHTPAADVAAALAARLDAEPAAEPTAGEVPQGAEKIAEVDSPTLTERIDAMMLDSDNVMAEAIGREVALARGETGDAAGATKATLDVLTERGFDTTGTEIHDNSGLSVDNRITPRLLDQVLHYAATDSELRPLLTALPVGGASGTLAERYGDLPGRGWVRAKTGTLDRTSALAGVVTSENGHQFTFAFISNDADVLAARAGADRLASLLREA